MSELRALASRRATENAPASPVAQILRVACAVPLTITLVLMGVATIDVGTRKTDARPLKGAVRSSAMQAAPVRKPVCGDGKCEAPETMANCMADCPGVTTPAMCGEEPHSDPGGWAVVWGASHKKASAAECCSACAAHAADPRNKKRPCNSWVFCHAREDHSEP